MERNTGRSIDQRTDPGHVRVAVSDMERSVGSYRGVLSFELHREAGGNAHLGAGEALYLNPDGNGIEIYRDRPRGDWSWQRERCGWIRRP
jgi:catechol 2,3-dioxygenase